MAGGRSSSSRNTLPASRAISTAASRYALIIRSLRLQEPLIRLGQISCPVPRRIPRQHLHFNCTVGVSGPAGIWIVGQPVLGTELVVNAVKDNRQLLRRIREKHGASRCLCDGLEGVLPGGIPSVFVLHGAHHDGIEQDSGAEGRLSRGLKIRAAGGLSRVRHHDNHTTALTGAFLKRFRAEEHRIINRSPGAVWNLTDRSLQRGNLRRKWSHLRHGFIKPKNRQAVIGPEDLLNEMASRIALAGHFLMLAEAGINHQSKVQWLLGLRLKYGNILLDPFLKHLEGLDG